MSHVAAAMHVASLSDHVRVEVDEEDCATVTIGSGPQQITVTGSRYDVHALIIEIDRQLSRYRYGAGLRLCEL